MLPTGVKEIKRESGIRARTSQGENRSQVEVQSPGERLGCEGGTIKVKLRIRFRVRVWVKGRNYQGGV